MNIEVGEYVRTINGTIFKIIDGNSDNYDIDFSYFKLEFLEDEWFEDNRYNDNGYFFNERNIVKHSKNIIDLVEVGDYVNGARVVSEKYHYNNINFINVDSEISYGWGEGAIMENEIESIVTKEQFSNMEYRL